MDFGFDAPVIAHVGEGGVFVEETAVPATHFVVGYYVAVLDVLFFEHEGGFFEEGGVYPGGDVPMFFGDEFIITFRFCNGLGFGLEFGSEGFVIEECPGVIKLVVPSSFKVFHSLNHTSKLIVSDKGEYCCVYSRGVGIVCGIVVCPP